MKSEITASFTLDNTVFVLTKSKIHVLTFKDKMMKDFQINSVLLGGIFGVILTIFYFITGVSVNSLILFIFSVVIPLYIFILQKYWRQLLTYPEYIDLNFAYLLDKNVQFLATENKNAYYDSHLAASKIINDKDPIVKVAGIYSQDSASIQLYEALGSNSLKLEIMDVYNFKSILDFWGIHPFGIFISKSLRINPYSFQKRSVENISESKLQLNQHIGAATINFDKYYNFLTPNELSALDLHFGVNSDRGILLSSDKLKALDSISRLSKSRKIQFS